MPLEVPGQVRMVPEVLQVPEPVVVPVGVGPSAEGGRGCAAVLMTWSRLTRIG
jgi:hypothetical protein